MLTHGYFIAMLERMRGISLKSLSMLQNRIGRKKLWTRLHRSSWPLVFRLAALYRWLFLKRVTIITVVGSLGKTTTVHAIRHVINLPSPSAAGNIGTYLAKQLLLTRPGTGVMVMEAGVDQPGLMAKYSRMIRPDIVVVTSIASEHNRSFKTLECTRWEKSRILADLSPHCLALLNRDDPHVRWMSGETRARTLTFGFDSASDFRAEDLTSEGLAGTGFTISCRGRKWQVRTGLIGTHMVYPALAAFIIGVELKVPPEVILQRLHSLRPAPLRLDPQRLANGAVLLRDEFKAAEESIASGIDTLAGIPAARRIVVIGEVSEPSGSVGPIYRRLGEKMGAIADRVIVVGDNFQRYSAGANRIGVEKGVFVNAGKGWQKAVKLLQAELREGDVVLIKGRDTQRLDRIALALQGVPVSCELIMCQAVRRCASCPQLHVVRRIEGQRHRRDSI